MNSNKVGLQSSSDGKAPVFYINRDQDITRHLKTKTQLRSARMNGCRVSAVQGRQVPSNLAAYFFAEGNVDSPLSTGEIGCYASHLKVAREVVERRLPYALVLEDDAIIPVSLQGALDEVLRSVPEQWDLVHLSNDPSYAYRPLKRLNGNRHLVRYSRVPFGAVGYLISARGARKLLAPIVRTWPIDTDFRQPWRFDIQVFGVVPKLISHDDSLGSVLLAYGQRSRGRRGLRRPTLQSPFGNPLHTPWGAWFNMRALGPAWWLRCALSNLWRRLLRDKSSPKSAQNAMSMFRSTSAASSN